MVHSLLCGGILCVSFSDFDRRGLLVELHEYHVSVLHGSIRVNTVNVCFRLLIFIVGVCLLGSSKARLFKRGGVGWLCVCS